MTEKILEALAKLDQANDNHWTKEGKPQLFPLRLFAGDQTLTQEAVELAAPGFLRVLPTLQGAQDEGVQGSAGAGKTDTKVEPAVQEVNPRELLKAAEEAMEQASVRKAKADQDFDKARAKVDECIDAVTKAGGNPTLADNLNQYYARQKDIAAERIRKKEIMKGIDLKELMFTRSPIDAAMGRKTGRGFQRPKQV